MRTGKQHLKDCGGWNGIGSSLLCRLVFFDGVLLPLPLPSPPPSLSVLDDMNVCHLFFIMYVYFPTVCAYLCRYSKQDEFYLWLREVKNIEPETLPVHMMYEICPQP